MSNEPKVIVPEVIPENVVDDYTLSVAERTHPLNEAGEPMFVPAMPGQQVLPGQQTTPSFPESLPSPKGVPPNPPVLGQPGGYPGVLGGQPGGYLEGSPEYEGGPGYVQPGILPGQAGYIEGQPSRGPVVYPGQGPLGQPEIIPISERGGYVEPYVQPTENEAQRKEIQPTPVVEGQPGQPVIDKPGPVILPHTTNLVP